MRPDFPLPDLAWEPTRPFWAAAQQNRLEIPRLRLMPSLCLYPRSQCRRCRGTSLTWTEVSGRATLFSWVVVTHPFLPQFREKIPFVPALVALEEDPAVRLPTEMVGCEPDDLRFDMAVAVVFGQLAYAGVEGSVTAPFFTSA